MSVLCVIFSTLLTYILVVFRIFRRQDSSIVEELRVNPLFYDFLSSLLSSFKKNDLCLYLPFPQLSSYSSLLYHLMCLCLCVCLKLSYVPLPVIQADILLRLIAQPWFWWRNDHMLFSSVSQMLKTLSPAFSSDAKSKRPASRRPSTWNCHRCVPGKRLLFAMKVWAWHFIS